MPNYRLIPGTPQHGFHYSRSTLQVFGGAYANGKTTALVVKALRIARDYPGANILLGRATYPKLNDTLRKVFFKWCPASWIVRMPTKDDNTCVLRNKTVINFRYIAQRGKQQQDGETTSNLLSATYDFIGIDQVEDPEITQKDIMDLFGRLRGDTVYRPEGLEDSTMPDTGPCWMALTCNPAHNWFFKEIVQPFMLWRDKGLYTEKLMVDPKSGQPIMELFEGDLYSNKHNLPEKFIRTQEAVYKGQAKKRYVQGLWAAFEGLVHPDYDHNRHAISRDAMVEHLVECIRRRVQIKILEGYDFGMAVPSCYLFAFIDDWGRIFVLDGYHEKEFNVYEQPAAIKNVRRRYSNMIKSKERIWADPSVFKRTVVAKNKKTGEAIAKIFRDDKVDMRAASNDYAGLAKVNGYLCGRPDVPHIVTDDVPGPMIYFNEDLTFIEDEITSYYWKKNPQGQAVDEPQDGSDDAMNTIKYMLTERPSAAEIVIPRGEQIPGWMYWQEMSEEEFTEREQEQA